MPTAVGARVLMEDLSAPAVVVLAPETAVTKSSNHARFAQSTYLHRRVRIRVNPEILCKLNSAPWSYRRLQRRYAQCSFPSQEQAELFIDALFDFIAQFDGKFLTPQVHLIEKKDVK